MMKIPTKWYFSTGLLFTSFVVFYQFYQAPDQRNTESYGEVSNENIRREATQRQQQQKSEPKITPISDQIGSSVSRQIMTSLNESDLRVGDSRLDFKPVSGLGAISYVHSALWLGDNVRISVIKSKAPAKNIICVLWNTTDLRSNYTIVKTDAHDLVFYGKPNGGAFIRCPYVKDGKTEAPFYVGLAIESASNVTTTTARVVLPVENRHMDWDRVYKNELKETSKGGDEGVVREPHRERVVEFTVCVPAMFNYSDAAQLVEKLEMVRLLGAGRVVLYDHSVADNVRSVLDFYHQEWVSGRDTLEVIAQSWKLPPVKVHYQGQLGTIDDCLYRYGWLSKYMVFDDLDEIIVPFRHANWSELIAEREKVKPGIVSFMFRMSVMNKDHFSPLKGTATNAVHYRSSVFGYTQRDKYIWHPTDKSKLIVNPRRAKIVDVHKVLDPKKPLDVVPTKLAILYHYRWPERPCDPEVTDTRVVTKFGQSLLARLESVWSRLKGVTMGGRHPRFTGIRATCENKTTTQ